MAEAEQIEQARPVRVQLDDNRGVRIELHERPKALRLVDGKIDGTGLPGAPQTAVIAAGARQAKGVVVPDPVLTNRILKYGLLTVYDVMLAPARQFTFKGGGAKGSLGSIYVRGVIRPIGDTVWPEIAEHREWRERGVWGGFKGDDEDGAEATFEAGPDGARWLCPGGPFKVYPRPIDGKFSVPAGFGALICWVKPDDDGEPLLLVGGAPATTGHFLEPCAEDVTILGTADLLLIK